MKIKLNKTIIITSIFIVEQSDHNLILNYLFTHFIRMQSINLNNDFLKILIYFDDDIRRVSFLIVLIRYSQNKNVSVIFYLIDSLN